LHADGKHVVFGEVIQGKEVGESPTTLSLQHIKQIQRCLVTAIERNPTNQRDKPLKEVKIVGCGQL